MQLSCCFLVIVVSLSRTTTAVSAVLTKADIPPDLPPALRRLVEQTFSSDHHERAIAAKKIGEMHGDAAAAVPFLIRLLDDQDADDAGNKYYYAQDALAAIGDPALDACIELATDPLKSQQEPGLKWMQGPGMSCLVKFDSPRATETLVRLLKSPDYGVRFHAVTCFKRRRDRDAVKPLLDALPRELHWFWDTQNDDGRRMEVVEALGFQRDWAAAPALRTILQDSKENEWLWGAAAWSLGQIGMRIDISTLTAVLQDRSLPTAIRSGAARGIGAYNPELTIPEVGRRESVRDDARMLYLLGGILSSRDESDDLRVAAARAMGDFGNPKAIEPLALAANSPAAAEIRFWAAVSVIRLSGGQPIDSGIAETIKSYKSTDYEGSGEDLAAQREAVKEISKRGLTASKWPSIAISVVVGAAVCGSIALFLFLKNRSRSTVK